MSHCNTDEFNYFSICEPLARCATRGWFSFIHQSFPKTTNCIRPTGSCNFVSLRKKFTRAYLFKIALEIM